MCNTESWQIKEWCSKCNTEYRVASKRVVKSSQYLLSFLELKDSQQYQTMKKMMRRLTGTSGSTSTSAYTIKSVGPVNNPQQATFSSKFSKTYEMLLYNKLQP